MWISGHCNIQGNEEADWHAKNSPPTSTEISKYNQVTFSDIKKTIAINTYNIWKNHWSK